MAEISQIQYEMEYPEGISQRMRVLEKLKVAPPNADLEQGFQEGLQNASVIMQVPARIVVAGNTEDISFSRPADLDLIQSTTLKPLALKTPPRVLTLSERPLDFLDLERPPPTPQNDEQIRAAGRLKREHSMSENAVCQNGQLVRNNSIPVLHGGFAAATSNPHHDNIRHGVSNIDPTVEGAADDMNVVNAASLRQQIIKLNKRLQLLEEENKEHARREMIMYSITVAFWLLSLIAGSGFAARSNLSTQVYCPTCWKYKGFTNSLFFCLCTVCHFIAHALNNVFLPESREKDLYL